MPSKLLHLLISEPQLSLSHANRRGLRGAHLLCRADNSVGHVDRSKNYFT